MLNDEFNYASKNPGVFTDARCHMPWIALQYGMKMPASYQVPASCDQSKGRKGDIQQQLCRVNTDYYITQKNRPFVCPRCSEFGRQKKDKKGKKKGKENVKQLEKHKKHRKQSKKRFNRTQDDDDKWPSCEEITTYTDYKLKCCDGTILGCRNSYVQHVTDGGFCDWGQPDPANLTALWDQCRLVAAEGFAYNVFQCINRDGQKGTCSNNCRGVDPNAIIIGGSAVLAASALAPALLPQVLSLGGLAAVGAGALVVGTQGGRCPVGFCRVSPI